MESPIFSRFSGLLIPSKHQAFFKDRFNRKTLSLQFLRETNKVHFFDELFDYPSQSKQSKGGSLEILYRDRV